MGPIQLLDLPNGILLQILEIAPSVTRLSHTCTRLLDLWRNVPSARTNWLLRCCRGNKTQALDLSISQFKDYEIAINLLHRSSYDPFMLSHVLIDLCRTEPASNAPLIAEPPQESLSSLLLQIGFGNSQNPSPISPTSTLEQQQIPVISPYKPNTSTESISPSSLFPSLVGALISPGNASLTADMSLYLKSTLFASTTAENLTSLSWIVNESHRTSKDGDKDAVGRNGVIETGFACAYFCVVGGHVDALRVLLEEGNVNPNGMDGFLVLVACKMGEVKCLEVLLGKGCDANVREGQGMAIAKTNGFQDIVHLLEGSMTK